MPPRKKAPARGKHKEPKQPTMAESLLLALRQATGELRLARLALEQLSENLGPPPGPFDLPADEEAREDVEPPGEAERQREAYVQRVRAFKEKWYAPEAAEAPSEARKSLRAALDEAAAPPVDPPEAP